MTEMTTTKCSRTVRDAAGFHTYGCRHAATSRDASGLPVCGVHANQDKQRIARAEKADAQRAHVRALAERCDEMSSRLGVRVSLEYGHDGNPTGRYVLDAVDLAAIANMAGR
jgi:hypothetical protein